MRQDIFAANSLARRFVVLVHDPVTDETDAYGPMTEWHAVIDADRRRKELDTEELGDVLVNLVALQRAPSTCAAEKTSDQVGGAVATVPPTAATERRGSGTNFGATTPGP